MEEEQELTTGIGQGIDYRDMVENLPHLVAVFLPDTTTAYANRALASFFGTTPEELRGRRWLTSLPDDEQAAIRRFLAGFTPENPLHFYQNLVERADKDPRWIEWTVQATFDASGRLRYFQSMGLDITERKLAQQALQQREHELAEAQRIAHLGNWISDFTRNEIRWSDEVYRIFGLNRSQWGATHEAFMQAVHPDDRERVQAAVDEALAGAAYDIEHRIVRPSGDVRTVYQNGVVDFDSDGTPLRMVGIVHDITEHRQAEERLMYLSYYDSLTGIPNRNYLLERIDQAIMRANQQNHAFALLHLDLDRFRTINEGLGHATGDTLLRLAAERLGDAEEGGELLARLGGDEFCLLVENITDSFQAATVARRLLAPLRTPFEVARQSFYLPGSVGIALYPRDGRDPGSLLRNAESAMYQVKRDGGNAYRFYSREMNESTLEQVALEGQLIRAVERLRGFRLEYQPKVEMGSGRIVGAEALLRWTRPDGVELPPAAFIPVLEQTGLIVELGRWIITEACRQVRAWGEQGLPMVPVAVNLAAPQFRHRGVAETVKAILNETALPPHLLELEVTESMLMTDVPDVVRTLNRFRELGVRIALDDFGTGFSSLAYLRRLPIDTLKIDRSFVNDLHNDAAGEPIVLAILSLASSLSLQTVAEGVETAHQHSFLRRHGCDLAQGYLFSKPLPPDGFAELLKSHPG
ncbi:MAG: EAL domain-containing protein [Ectothiorhodospiraceae bacterium]|nr:EAL domain-containing protein [Ectothiorhodospiraceae bacterium]